MEGCGLTAVDLSDVAAGGDAVDDAHGAARAVARDGAQRAAAVGAGVSRAGHQVRAARQQPVQLRHAPTLPLRLRRRPETAGHQENEGHCQERARNGARRHRTSVDRCFSNAGVAP